MRLFFLFYIFCFVTTSAWAETPADHLSALLKNMHSMQANFIQTIEDKNGQAMQKNTGKMALQRPNQFRWEVLTPLHQLIVTNGKILWIYDPDLEQVTIRKLVKAAGETPAMLLSDETLSLAKEFNVKALKSSSDHLNWYVLTPKDQGSIISTLKLGFNQNQIRLMELEDHLGHITHIQFKEIKFNRSFSSNLFNFKPPAHVDIIDETKS